MTQMKKDCDDTWIWQFYKKNDGDDSSVVCVICKDSMQSDDLDVLVTHLDSVHPTTKHAPANNQDEFHDSGSDYIPCEEASDVETNRKKKTSIWDKFQYVDRESAICKMCGKVLSHRSTTSNLRKHLIRSHSIADRLSNTRGPAQRAAENGLTDKSGDEEAEQDVIGRKTSKIWNHFRIISKTQARCKHCGSVLSYRTTSTNLRKHLVTRHKDIDIDTYFSMEIEELDRSDKDSTWDSSSPPEKFESVKIETVLPAPRARRRSSARKRPRTASPELVYMDDSFPVARQPSAEDERLDDSELFSRYLVSIMQRLPRLQRYQVQAELMGVVMKAQIEYETSLAASTSSRRNSGNHKSQ